MSSVGNPRRNARKRNPPATRRRALELLAGSHDGATEAIMLAHGFTIEMLVDLVRAGLATAKAERVVAGWRKFAVHRPKGGSVAGEAAPRMAANSPRNTRASQIPSSYHPTALS
jgi:hypothetical protein